MNKLKDELERLDKDTEEINIKRIDKSKKGEISYSMQQELQIALARLDQCKRDIAIFKKDLEEDLKTVRDKIQIIATGRAIEETEDKKLVHYSLLRKMDYIKDKIKQLDEATK